jgi:hypothetical protein
MYSGFEICCASLKNLFPADLCVHSAMGWPLLFPRAFSVLIYGTERDNSGVAKPVIHGPMRFASQFHFDVRSS